MKYEKEKEDKSIMKQIILVIILVVVAVFGYFVWPVPYLTTQMQEDLLKKDQTQELISGNIDPEGRRGESYIKYVDKTKSFIDNINKEQQIYMDKVD